MSTKMPSAAKYVGVSNLFHDENFDDDDDYYGHVDYDHDDDDNFVCQLKCPWQHEMYVLPTCLKGFSFKEHHSKDWIRSKLFKFLKHFQ